MKCEIIRDLFPSYLDGLTSEESNAEIRLHLEDCKPCGEILAQMQQETQEESSEKTGKDEKRKINPFRKFNRRMKAAVAAAVAVCVCIGGVGYKVIAYGYAIDPNEITLDVRLDAEMLYLDFAVEKGNLMHWGTMCDESSVEIGLRKVLALSGDNFGSNPHEFSWGMSLNALTVGAGERLEVAMADGGLTIVETEDEEITMTVGEDAAEGNSVAITGNDVSPTTMLLFQEGDEATSIVIGDRAEMDLEDYVVVIDYGKEKVEYTVGELMEMAEETN